MPKSLDPQTYHPINEQIFRTANQNGYFCTDPLTKSAADSLRFDLNGYRKALRVTNHPNWGLYEFSSVSIRKITPDQINPQHPELTHFIEVYPAGPAWTEGASYAAITAGLTRNTQTPAPSAIPQRATPAPAHTTKTIESDALDRLLQEAKPK